MSSPPTGPTDTAVVESSGAARTLGVVVLHQPDRPVAELPAVRDLVPQVDELLVVHNGGDADTPPGIRSVRFGTNRGTAAAWNLALHEAHALGCRYLFLLDQDSTPYPEAVATALAEIQAVRAAAVVQPARPDRLGLDPFPWNTVASGSLLDANVLRHLGGFDERLFVDEVDHELFARLVADGHVVRPLPAPTIGHQTGTPRHVRFLGQKAVVSGHGESRRRVQGFSAGVLVRRGLRRAPSTSARLLLRHALTAAKGLAAGETGASRALVSGLLAGLATGDPPPRAAERVCPYCEGPLLGRYAQVTDWRFGTGPPADVYWCPECGALGAGRVPAPGEIASWYSDYYTHDPEPARSRIWSRLWPTPGRRRELERLRAYRTPLGTSGRFLEVGTGSGERLLQFAAAGWEVVGQDLDPKAGRLARPAGIEVHQCEVSDLVDREKPFDLIGLSHVLEHVAEPAQLLRDCAALLAPAGRICVVSPNADGLGRLLFGRWWFGLEQPRHLAIPTLESLRRVTSRVPLRAVQAESTAANAAVILGGSLARVVEDRLPPGNLRRGAAFGMHFLGQALGRAAVVVAPKRGEEVVWVAQRLEP